MKKRLAILGATGSIGKSSLGVADSYPDEFEPVLFSAHRDAAALRALGARYPRAALALTGAAAAGGAGGGQDGISYTGQEGLLRALADLHPDLVVNGIAGAAGLLPSLASLEAGADLALANKETIVMAAPVAFEAARKAGRRILPVDSEHSAVFHLVEAHGAEAIEEVVLTASGGPFRDWPAEKLATVRAEDALAHPTWKMGGKITVDSASLANKGLEVIEAVRLFGVPAEAVKVVVHPQSLVHSLVRLKDGSLYAQISKPDMRLPIHNALFWPRVLPCPFGRLPLEGQTLTFEKPRDTVFPMLPLAYEAARLSDRYPAAYNAADEIAVAAFLAGRLSFQDIPRVTQGVLEADWSGGVDSLPAIMDADRNARALAERLIGD